MVDCHRWIMGEKGDEEVKATALITRSDARLNLHEASSVLRKLCELANDLIVPICDSFALVRDAGVRVARGVDVSSSAVGTEGRGRANDVHVEDVVEEDLQKARRNSVRESSGE